MLGYAILLLIVGFLLAFLEVILPTGGIFGVLTFISLSASIALAFQDGNQTGIIFIIATAVGIPLSIIVGLVLLPKTPFGKRMILKNDVDTEEERGQAGVCETDYSNLLGKDGKTITPLRPSGIAMIDDERLSVVADGEMLDSGETITVVRIDGNSIVVEKKD